MLQLGTALAALLVGAGLVLTLVHGGGADLATTGLHASHGGLAAVWPRDPAGWLITAGVGVLLATPIARLVAAAIGFAREGDWRYVGLTAAILALTACGWLLGGG